MLKPKPKNRIREFRKAKRMKQAVLADKEGVFQSEISEVEIGDRKPNKYLARKISKALVKSIDEIYWEIAHLMMLRKERIHKKEMCYIVKKCTHVV